MREKVEKQNILDIFDYNILTYKEKVYIRTSNKTIM